MSTDRYREWDAAYVLGALEADERREYEAHLETCDDCARAVAELAGMPGMLSHVDAATALAIADEPEPRPSGSHLVTASAARRLRRRRRITVVAGAAALLVALAGGAAIGTALPLGSATAPAATVAMQPVGTASMTARLAVTRVSWGTRFDWSCRYPQHAAYRAATYDLVVTTADGGTRTVASWSGAGAAATGLSASTDIPLADIRSVDIRPGGSDTPLVRTTL